MFPLGSHTVQVLYTLPSHISGIEPPTINILFDLADWDKALHVSPPGMTSEYCLNKAKTEKIKKSDLLYNISKIY